MAAIWGLVSSVWTGIFLLLNLGGLAAFIIVHYPHPEPYFLQPLYLGLLAAFGLNIACVLISRYRFRLAQLGFLMTHVGIVTALVGGAMTHWLGEDGQMRIAEGGAASSFLVERTGGFYRAKEIRLATLAGLRHSEAFDVAPPARLPAFEVPGTGLKVEVLDYLPRALKRREALPFEGGSPALRFRIGMAVASVEDWMGADDPETGERPIGNGLVARYRRLPGRLDESRPDLPADKSLSFLEDETGSLALLECNGKGRRVLHPVAVGAPPLVCSLSPLKVSALERLPSALVVSGFAEDANGSEEALRLRLSKGGETRTLWAAWGEPTRAAIGGTELFLHFGNPQRDLGFSLHLDDFRKQDYEGSAIPMAYESQVRLDDPEAGLHDLPANIHMNAPLLHRGWTFFQAAFAPAERPGDPEETILQVLHDPGKPVVYTGAVLVVAGVVFMFYLKPWMRARGWL